MSYGLNAYDWTDADEYEAAPPPAVPVTVSEYGLTVLPPDAPAQFARSGLIPVAFGLPVALSALSYAGGGLTFLSDLATVALTATCLVLAIIELTQFGRRQGLGALLIYGGVLIWFCHDYMVRWFGHDFGRYEPNFAGVHADTVARALFYHCLYVELMVIAFRWPVLRFVDRLVVSVPEPPARRFYLGLVMAMLVIGWSAFIFTTDVLPVSLFKACLWWVPGVGTATFTVGRTGNMNFNFGAYIAQLIEVGQVGGILGAVYALLVARSLPGKIFGWFTWCFWTSYSFNSYRRGDIAFMGLPVVGVMFLLYHAQAGDPLRRARNIRSLVVTASVTGLLWFGVQMQTAQRSGGGPVRLFEVAGSTMFSEGLNTWAIMPEQVPFPDDTVAGEGVIRPLPETLWWFLTGPIPRALWTTKPVEQFSLWYSALISHDKRGLASGGVNGTTVSTGAVGFWYFRYGPAGVVEGGLLFGWMTGVAERALRRAQGQPIKVLFAMGYATFLFRSYRDLWWHNLYPIIIAGVVLTVVVRLLFGGRAADPREPTPA